MWPDAAQVELVLETWARASRASARTVSSKATDYADFVARSNPFCGSVPGLEEINPCSYSSVWSQGQEFCGNEWGLVIAGGYA